jgi:NAD(P)-dependent dehydrogenase (short-subunit alcohol dehydrogenase family)
MERFVGVPCLVTGAGRGIGRAVAEALAAEGASVGLMARTEAQCHEVAAGIGERAAALPGDVTSSDDCVRAVETLAERFGAPRVVINAAGISPIRSRAESHDLEAFRLTFDVNVGGVVTVLQAASPHLLAGGGAVVNVASMLGLAASPRLAGYGASKAAVIQLTRTLANEWGPRDVRVNAVCPGFVATDLSAPVLEREHLRAEILESTPLGRIASMPEVVRPILFLASSDASYISGVALAVDGGTTA